MGAVHLPALILSACLVAIVLWEAFETIVVPRTISRRLRLARLSFGFLWMQRNRAAKMLHGDTRRERCLAVFGPVSLLGLTSEAVRDNGQVNPKGASGARW